MCFKHWDSVAKNVWNQLNLREITSTIHIENESELENYSDKFINIKSIGITAGASTPDDIIKSVVQKIENIIRKDK